MVTSATAQLTAAKFGVSVIAAALLYGAVLIFCRRLRYRSAAWHALRFSFAVYMAFLLVLTLSPGSGEGREANIIPFSTVTYAFSEGSAAVKLTAVLNVAAFVPLGVYLPALTSGRFGLFSTFAVSLFVTLMIELLQVALPVNRVFDVDDILLNALGGMAGYAAYVLLFRKRRRARA